VFPAGLIVAEATCDNLDATEMTSTANEVKNVATSENMDDTISTVATADIVLDKRQAIVDSEVNQLSSLANELGCAGDYRKSAEEAVVPQASVQPLSLGIDLQLAASRQEK
jgi:ribosome assembly protein YihI (activator of Der GTPase)